jgi:hypothetical protein
MRMSNSQNWLEWSTNEWPWLTNIHRRIENLNSLPNWHSQKKNIDVGEVQMRAQANMSVISLEEFMAAGWAPLTCWSFHHGMKQEVHSMS